MQPSLILSFKKNISLIEESESELTIQSPLVALNIPMRALKIKQVSPGLRSALKILAAEGATEEDLSDVVIEADGLSALSTFYSYLQKFTHRGNLCHTLVWEGAILATRVPLSPEPKFKMQKATLDKKYVLSEFAYCHRQQEQLVLESPLSHAQIILADSRCAAAIAELAQPIDCQEICAKINGILPEAMQLFFSLLLSSEMLCEVKENGNTIEDESEALLQWEFHDLLFHSRTRAGRHANPIGRTYRFLEKIKPLNAVKPQVYSEIIELYKPDMEQIEKVDKSFTFVLEERKSIRSYGERSLTDKQLGEFLYRSARVRKIVPTEREELSTRPYANGGAAYELELYPIVNTCDGIPGGFYHYCPLEHQLGRISGMNSQVKALLEEAQRANREGCTPQVLIIITARFQRMAWNYESIAYATVLKNVGALYQTLYMVATDMNLAACAIGEGNSDLFATAAGTDYYVESSVGEFAIGSQPTK